VNEMPPDAPAESVAAVERTLLFQYGSNMTADRLRSGLEKHAPRFAPAGTPLELELLGPARLGGWMFAVDLFGAGGQHRVADIVPGNDVSEVWGALYELPLELVRRSDGRRSVLDRIEGHRTELHPENNLPLQVTVEFDCEQVDAWTFVGRTDARERCARGYPEATVSPSYLQAIVDGARTIGVPDAYVRELETTLARYV
jgi:hypothetical protein